jgi:hypothetical protein
MELVAGQSLTFHAKACADAYKKVGAKTTVNV